MAEAASMLAASSTVTAVAAAGAAASAAGTTRSRYEMGLGAYVQNTAPSRRNIPSSPDGNNAASYMNSLRTPTSALRSSGPAARGAIGVHIHCQGRCTHAHHAYSSDDVHPIPTIRRGSHPFIDEYRPLDPYQFPPGADHTGLGCGCLWCYWRDFLEDDIQKYHTTCRLLRETYLWNLDELVRRHRALSGKPRTEKDKELDKLYMYYVSRVREAYENHCRHHRLLFHDTCLEWEMPEKGFLREEDVEPPTRTSLHLSSASLRTLLLLPGRETHPPFLRSCSESRIDTNAGRDSVIVAKGKDAEPEAVNTVVSAGVDSVDDDRDSVPEIKVDTLPENTPTKSQSKYDRFSMKRLRHQLWPVKPHEKCGDKPEVDQDNIKEHQSEALPTPEPEQGVEAEVNAETDGEAVPETVLA
ncbi:hypothetical protein GGS20DRAFT_481154 [Poronia punctata]|nr:hypothetical protein GGS20DRAFT_481154 [Poronia punctata]